MTVTIDEPIVVAPTESPPSGVTVRECGEPLVEVPETDGIHVAAAYHERGIAAAGDRVFVRRRVLDALRQASAALPAGIEILIWDGLRSLETQAEIVENFRATLPDPSSDEAVERYLALPPPSQDVFLRIPPPHTTGGAVDVTLCDPGGRPLDLGADFDQFDEKAWLDYYENGGQPEHRHRRRMLYWTMLSVGFAPYSWEFWHYEFGTMVAAAFHGRSVAEYGAAVPWTSFGSR
jgi:D-alanyl-D-alanine dipeptidase